MGELFKKLVSLVHDNYTPIKDLDEEEWGGDEHRTRRTSTTSAREHSKESPRRASKGSVTSKGSARKTSTTSSKGSVSVSVRRPQTSSPGVMRISDFDIIPTLQKPTVRPAQRKKRETGLRRTRSSKCYEVSSDLLPGADKPNIDNFKEIFPSFDEILYDHGLKDKLKDISESIFLGRGFTKVERSADTSGSTRQVT